MDFNKFKKVTKVEFEEQEIIDILGLYTFKYEVMVGRIDIEYGQMYEAPVLNLDKLIELSKLFETTKIDVDDYSNGGCESCDYGSDYGHIISIYDSPIVKVIK